MKVEQTWSLLWNLLRSKTWSGFFNRDFTSIEILTTIVVVFIKVSCDRQIFGTSMDDKMIVPLCYAIQSPCDETLTVTIIDCSVPNICRSQETLTKIWRSSIVLKISIEVQSRLENRAGPYWCDFIIIPDGGVLKYEKWWVDPVMNNPRDLNCHKRPVLCYNIRMSHRIVFYKLIEPTQLLVHQMNKIKTCIQN